MKRPHVSEAAEVAWFWFGFDGSTKSDERRGLQREEGRANE